MVNVPALSISRDDLLVEADRREALGQFQLELAVGEVCDQTAHGSRVNPVGVGHDPSDAQTRPPGHVVALRPEADADIDCFMLCALPCHLLRRLTRQ